MSRPSPSACQEFPAAGFAAIGPLTPDLTAMHRILVANIGTGFGAATLHADGRRLGVLPQRSGAYVA